MTAPTVTLAQIERLKPCEERFAELAKRLPQDGPITAAIAAEAGATLEDIAWVVAKLRREDPDIERRVRLWMADCVAHVLHLYERQETSDTPRDAIVAARRCARGEIDESAWNNARAAAWDSWRSASDPAAVFVAQAAAWCDADLAVDAAAWNAVTIAGGGFIAREAVVAPVRAAERQWQLDRLVLWLSDPEPEDWPLPEWAAHDREARDAG